MTYTKYSASGNDFVIFHTFIKKDYSELAKTLCSRTQGIGADGMAVLLPHDTLDFQWLFYNSDGSIASMCGNATRACAHYAFNNNLASQNLSFLTSAGKISCEVNGLVVETQLTPAVILKEEFEQDGRTWYLIDTGVPHLVTLVDDLNDYDHNLCEKMRYEHNANVNFALIKDKKIYLRTYERGVEGETLACGTGMAACFLRAYNLGLVDKKTFVYSKSNEELTLRLEDNDVYFKGSVQQVFTTTI